MSVNTLKEKVEEYLELLKAIKQKTGDERTALAILQEVNKDVRMDRISFERGNGKDNGSPRNHTRMATKRQLSFLSKLGVEVPEGLTREQASAMLDKKLAADDAGESGGSTEHEWY